MSDLGTVNISVDKIFSPFIKGTQKPSRILQGMADGIRKDGWDKSRQVGVIEHASGMYQVKTSLLWFRAGLLADLKTIPCVIY